MEASTAYMEVLKLFNMYVCTYNQTDDERLTMYWCTCGYIIWTAFLYN